MSLQTLAMPAWLRQGAARLRLRSEIWIWRHGWLWLLAAALLVTGGGGLVWGHQRVTAEVGRTTLLQSRLAAMPSRIPGAADARAESESVEGHPANSTPSVNIDPMSEHEALSNEVRLLYALAAREQIPVLQVEFADSQAGDARHPGLHRLLVAVPVQTTYPQLRRFIESTLREMPNASLDRMSFKRNQVSSPMVDVEMHWSLWSVPDTAEAAELRVSATAPATAAASAPRSTP